MAGNIKTALARAYHVSQVGGNHAAALAELRAALADDPDLMTAARAEHERLARFMGSLRGQARGGCHISKMTHGLLTAALR